MPPDLGITVEQAIDVYETVQARLLALLKHVGRPGTCRGCPERVIWVFHIHTGKWTPYNQDGSPHWSTCPKAKEFKRGELKERGKDDGTNNRASDLRDDR
jgi:hypothetical protein